MSTKMLQPAEMSEAPTNDSQEVPVQTQRTSIHYEPQRTSTHYEPQRARIHYEREEVEPYYYESPLTDVRYPDPQVNTRYNREPPLVNPRYRESSEVDVRQSNGQPVQRETAQVVIRQFRKRDHSEIAYVFYENNVRKITLVWNMERMEFMSSDITLRGICSLQYLFPSIFYGNDSVTNMVTPAYIRKFHQIVERESKKAGKYI